MGFELGSAPRTVALAAPLIQPHVRGHVALHVRERAGGHDTVLAEFIRAEVECIQSPENEEAAAAWRERREPDFSPFS